MTTTTTTHALTDPRYYKTHGLKIPAENYTQQQQQQQPDVSASVR